MTIGHFPASHREAMMVAVGFNLRIKASRPPPRRVATLDLIPTRTVHHIQRRGAEEEQETPLEMFSSDDVHVDFQRIG